MNELNNTPDNEAQHQDEPIYYHKHRNPVWAGIFVLLIGVVFLLKQLGYIFPVWFFTWPVFMIALGFFLALRHGFRGAGWVVLILIGLAFLLDEMTPGLNLRNYVWPFVIILIGLVLIIRPGNRYARRWKRHYRRHWEAGKQWEKYYPGFEGNPVPDSSDFIDVTSVFSGIKKKILSKNFKGGDVTNFMGGTEINLTQADINGKIKIDATNIFGGTKLIVPPTWDVQSNVTCIFGGVDDKRQFNGETPDPNKVIYLDGTCLFGGIEIRSF